ncbi:MAG: NifB/NifX family molybdenum-iron cluster-binding protein, partial [Bacteroidota bacterium]
IIPLKINFIMMKVAIPTRMDVVDEHFGHCEFYTVFTIENSKVIKKEIFRSPQGCGCKSDIATTLRTLGVTVMLAGNMGQGAFQVLGNAGLKVIRGCNGNVDALIGEYISGNISDSEISCSQHQHGEGHQCNH